MTLGGRRHAENETPAGLCAACFAGRRAFRPVRMAPVPEPHPRRGPEAGAARHRERMGALPRPDARIGDHRAYDHAQASRRGCRQRRPTGNFGGSPATPRANPAELQARFPQPRQPTGQGHGPCVRCQPRRRQPDTQPGRQPGPEGRIGCRIGAAGSGRPCPRESGPVRARFADAGAHASRPADRARQSRHGG